MNIKNITKNRHLIVFLIWPLVAAFLSFATKTNALGSAFLFIIIPSIYITYISSEPAKRVGIFALITAVPAIIVTDYIMEATRQWWMPSSIFPFRLFQFVSIDTVLWAVSYIYFIVMFYEYFIWHHHDMHAWHPRMKLLVAILFAIFLVFLIVYITFPMILSSIPYAYFIVGVIFMFIPTVMAVLNRPLLLPKFLTLGAYSFYFWFVYEIVGLKLGWWMFPSSQYIGFVSLFGVRFPFEEFFFWMFFLSMSIVVYYKTFDSEEK